MPRPTPRAALAGAAALLALAGLAGCRSATTGAATGPGTTPPTTAAPAAPTTTIPTGPTGPGGPSGRGGTTRLTAVNLGVTLELPASFGDVESRSSTFVARRHRPQAVLSIERVEPGALQRQARPGEQVAATTVDGRPAVEVVDAAVPGLPGGSRANELLVEGPAGPLRITLSAPAAELDGLWATARGTLAFQG